MPQLNIVRHKYNHNLVPVRFVPVVKRTFGTGLRDQQEPVLFEGEHLAHKAFDGHCAFTLAEVPEALRRPGLVPSVKKIRPAYGYRA